MKKYTLYINTTDHDEMIIALSSGSELLRQKKVRAARRQAEKLIPMIADFLSAQKISLSDLEKIMVARAGNSFTALRIGVITANALAYALKIPVVAEKKLGPKNKRFGKYSIVEPLYDREPTIGISKKPKL